MLDWLFFDNIYSLAYIIFLLIGIKYMIKYFDNIKIKKKNISDVSDTLHTDETSVYTMDECTLIQIEENHFNSLICALKNLKTVIKNYN